MKIVITRHPAFVEYLLDKGIIKEGEYEVIEHASPEKIMKRRVIASGLPLHLACLCERVFTVSINLPLELRGKELTLEDMKKYAGDIQEYIVLRVNREEA